jgi:hypothetical protein
MLVRMIRDIPSVYYQAHFGRIQRLIACAATKSADCDDLDTHQVRTIAVEKRVADPLGGVHLKRPERHRHVVIAKKLLPLNCRSGRCSPSAQQEDLLPDGVVAKV